jgi:serine/threonine-protein kinase HipA
MAAQELRRSVLVYADWPGLNNPTLLGILRSTRVKGKEVFSFEYNDAWLKSGNAQNLDPDLRLYSGPQYLAGEKSNFGIFLDSSPDRWGRTLMDRREALLARREDRKPRPLFETDYLLGVFDGHRMGALRFKEKEEGPFLNDNKDMASPPWTSIRELEHAGLELEKGIGKDSDQMKWLNMLMAPGSSLGGARPKASIVDPKGYLWIAKFPSTNDKRDIGGWEMVLHHLATISGINVPEVTAGKYVGAHHTFLSKRFDRKERTGRIHFASAMTLLSQTDGAGVGTGVSYLDLVEFIAKNGANVDKDLEELWRRVVFNICVSNVDDHLRNHGFLLTGDGWTLSPAYDMNPVETGDGLSLNISKTDNAQNLDVAIEVAPYFRLSSKNADEIVHAVRKGVSKWNTIAEKTGISRSERDAMAGAFRFA